MTTRQIPITPLNLYSYIRVDTHSDETLVSVYNCDIKHIDLLIMQLQALKAKVVPQPKQTDEELVKIVFGENLGAASLVDDTEPSQMTAVLGQKPDPTDWYKKVLQKPVEKPVPQPAIIREPMPPMPQPKRGKNILNVIGVATKARKSYGNNYGGKKNENMNADIIKGESIRIYGISEQRQRWDEVNKRHVYYHEVYDRTFKIGDTVEYSSYNFAYTGRIVSIGEKTVKIDDGYDSRERSKITQLDIHTFIWRNWDLDLKKIADDRANWYD